MQKSFGLLNGVGAVDMVRMRGKSYRDHASGCIHELDRVSSRAASFSDKLYADDLHNEFSTCGMAPLHGCVRTLPITRKPSVSISNPLIIAVVRPRLVSFALNR